MAKNRRLTRWADNQSKNLPKETLLLRKRNHWYVLTQPLSIATFVFLSAVLSTGFLFINFLRDFLLFAVITVINLMIYLSAIIKFLADWYCHFYVLTTRRIMEISYKPLFSKNINNVIINQVKSTEIDVEMEGMLAQLLNIGSVIITFDRPTHQQEFWLHSISDPKSVGFLLAERLDKAKPDSSGSFVWVKPKSKDDRFKIIEDIVVDESTED